jgi:hypothetical protein
MNVSAICVGYANEDESSRDVQEGPDVSLITGRVRMMGHSTGVEEEVDGSKVNALMKRNELTTLAISSASKIVSCASERYFLNRAFPNNRLNCGMLKVQLKCQGRLHCFA